MLLKYSFQIKSEEKTYRTLVSVTKNSKVWAIDKIIHSMTNPIKNSKAWLKTQKYEQLTNSYTVNMFKPTPLKIQNGLCM